MNQNRRANRHNGHGYTVPDVSHRKIISTEVADGTLEGKRMMLSPANYRVQMQISVDCGPYTNFWNPWFRKAESKPFS